MRFGRKEEREALKHTQEAREAVGSAVLALPKAQQASIIDSMLESPHLSVELKLDLVRNVDKRRIPCKSEVLTELRTRIEAEKRSREAQAERAKSARARKRYLRERGEDYDRNGPDPVE